ncbi:MAG: transcriptional repressor [Alphaproteobacteria bacterium]|nr:transcriptional repressor [Alphaproteobacteria bacterium]
MTGLDGPENAAAAQDRIRASGLRPTRQRVALARLLFARGSRHVTAEALHGEAGGEGIRVSLATVYNTLHQFVRVGLLREVMVNPGRSYFDTNVGAHHHFFHEASGELKDIDATEVDLSSLPEPPAGTRIERIDVVIRLRDERS